MAVSSAQFLVEFPEFAAVNAQSGGTALIEAKLAHAAHHVSASLWGARYDYGVYLYAAHLLSMGPMGQSARLNKFSRDTTYSVMYDDEIRALPVRMLTT